MKVLGVQDRKTERIQLLVLGANTFEEKMILGALGSILGSGDCTVIVTRGDVCLLAFCGCPAGVEDPDEEGGE